MNTQQERNARMEERLRELIARRKGGTARLADLSADGLAPEDRVGLLLAAAVLMGRRWKGTAWTAKEAALLDSWEDAPQTPEGKTLRRARRRLCRVLLASRR